MPTEFVTVTLCGPVAAVDAITKVAVIEAPVWVVVTPVTVTPVPDTWTTESDDRLDPLKVTVTLVPWVPAVGEMLLRTGVPKTRK